jgi:hypothetical protein
VTRGLLGGLRVWDRLGPNVCRALWKVQQLFVVQVGIERQKRVPSCAAGGV